MHMVGRKRSARQPQKAGRQTPVRVLLVDDSVMIREGLKMLLGNYRNLAIAGEASTGRELFDLLPRCRPDVVLMDIRLKDESGIDLCTRLRQLCPRLPVLFLTAYDDHDLLHDAMGAGGQGFLTKDASGATIAASLEALATGQPFLDPHATDYLLARLRRGVFPSANLNPCSPTPEDLRMLSLVAAGKTNREMGQELGLSASRVKGHLHRLFRQLNISRRSEAATYFATLQRNGAP